MITYLLAPATLALVAAGVAWSSDPTTDRPEDPGHVSCSHAGHAGHSHSCATAYVIPKTLEQLAAESGRIVIGNVVETRSDWHPKRRVIVTHAKIRVQDSLAGATPEHVEICTLGGKVGDMQMLVSEVRQVRKGEQLALFLRWDSTLEAWVSTGGTQGVFSVARQGDVDRIVPSQPHLTTDSFDAADTDLRGGIALSTFASKVREMKRGAVR